MVDKLLRRARGDKQQFDINAVHEVEEQLAELVLPARIKKDLDRKLAQVDDILADRKLAALQMQAGERLKAASRERCRTRWLRNERFTDSCRMVRRRPE